MPEAIPSAAKRFRSPRSKRARSPNRHPTEGRLRTLTVSERTATSATAAVTYTCEGEATVTDAGFLLKKTGQSDETRQSCGTAATSLCYTFTGLSENTSYEVAAYVVTPSKTWRSTAVRVHHRGRRRHAADNNTRHKGWAELPNEVSNGDYLYVDHECAMEKGARGPQLHRLLRKSKLCPVWGRRAVARRLCRRRTSSAKNSYKDDPDLPYEQVGKWDGYTRGHMLGSAERLVSREANSQVMYFSNIGPQLGQNDYFNGGGGQWNTAEDWVDEQWRGLADTCYQVVGCYWANTNKKVSGTTIPTHYFTVLLKAKKSAGKKWVVNCTRDELQCIALFIEHKSYSKNAVTKPAQFDSKGIFMRVSDLEAKTGHKFFMNVPNAPKDTYDTRDWNF